MSAAGPRGGGPTAVIADDHQAMRLGVRMALMRGGFDVVAEAADCAGAVDATVREQPDVCLLDIRMPGGGIEAAAAISASVPSTAVVMLTVSNDTDDVLASLRAGALGYLPKDTRPDRLPAALCGVLKGEAALPRALVGRVLSEFRDVEAPAALLRSDESCSDRVHGGLNPVLQLELLEDVRHVLLDRVLADRQRLADRGVVGAIGEQPQHVELARRQDVRVVRLAFARLIAARHPRDQRAHDLARDDALVRGRLANRAGDLACPCILQQVPVSPGGQCFAYVALVDGYGQDDDVDLWKRRDDLADRLDARRIGHVEVDHNDIWRELPSQRHRAVRVRCLADDSHAFAREHVAQALAEEMVIVCEHDPQLVSHRFH